MCWSPDLESGGRRLIHGFPKVVSGSLVRHFFINFGMSWDVSGSGLGTFLDGLGMVLKNAGWGRKVTLFKSCVFFLF